MLFLKESESPQSSHFLYREIVNHKDELIDLPKVTEPAVTKQNLIFRYLNSCHTVFEMFHVVLVVKSPSASAGDIRDMIQSLNLEDHLKEGMKTLVHGKDSINIIYYCYCFVIGTF